MNLSASPTTYSAELARTWLSVKWLGDASVWGTRHPSSRRVTARDALSGSRRARAEVAGWGTPDPALWGPR